MAPRLATKTAPLDVLHVVGVHIDGGVPTYVRELVRRQRQDGMAVGVACHPVSVLWAMLEDAGLGDTLVNVDIGCDPRRIPTVGPELRRAVVDHEPAVVHMHSSCAGLVGRTALAGLPVVRIFQPHCWSFQAVPSMLRGLARAFEWGAAGWVDLVICGSESERHELALAGFEPSGAEVVVIPNFVDTSHFRPVSRAERHRAQIDRFGSVAPTAVFLGRLAPQKGVDRLLAAFSILQPRMPEARLVVVGHGPEGERYRNRAGANVLFQGYSREPAQWLQLADVGVYPSRYDTMSLAVLETLACGVPVVVSNAGGMAEILSGVESLAGEVVPDPDNAEALAEVMGRWLQRTQRSDEAEASGHAARRRSAQFEVSGWFDRMSAAYARLGTRQPIPLEPPDGRRQAQPGSRVTGS